MKPPKELKLKLCDHAESVPKCDDCTHGRLGAHRQIADCFSGGVCRRANEYVTCVTYTYRLVPKAKKEAK